MRNWLLALVFALALGGFFQLDANVRRAEVKSIWLIYDQVTGALKGVLCARGTDGKVHPVLSEECCCIVGDSSSSGSSSSSEESSASSGQSSGSSVASSGSSGSSNVPWPGVGWYCTAYKGNGFMSCDCASLEELVPTIECTYIETEEAWDAYDFGVCHCDYNGIIYYVWKYETDYVRHATSEECAANCDVTGG